MAKQKFSNAEEAKAFIETTKEELSIAKEEMKAFAKANKLSMKEDNSGDAKHGKKWKKFADLVEKKQTSIEEAKEWLKENKPKKEAAPRETKYEYPEDCTSEADKKKYRAKMRAAAKRAEKGESEPKEKKDKKKKKEAPVEDKKSSKKDKKEKKAKKEETEDDED